MTLTIVISVENLSKCKLTGILTNDLNIWATRFRRKPNPNLKIGLTDHDNQVGDAL